jgi:hypothetical protein
MVVFVFSCMSESHFKCCLLLEVLQRYTTHGVDTE